MALFVCSKLNIFIRFSFSQRLGVEKKSPGTFNCNAQESDSIEFVCFSIRFIYLQKRMNESIGHTLVFPHLC